MASAVLLPRLMSVGENACEQLPSVLASLNCSKPLIVTDRMMVNLGYVSRLHDILAAADIQADVFADTLPEPTVASIRSGVEHARHGDFDCIVALGGGSPIDSAKAIGVLARYGGEMRDYKFPRVVNEPGLPLIAIPTTAGTGSEVTRFTIITDETCDEKMLCVGLAFMPVAALIDYTLTLSLPARITADTGIDALTHAIEAYVSKKANAYSDSQALAAMRLIGPNLRKAYHNGADKAAREAMMLGSTLAGMAFSNASVALVHGMSRPIGAFFHVPHGLSNAMLLPAITAFSIPSARSRYADCARAMGIVAADVTDELASETLVEELRSINTDLSVPSLLDFGVDRQVFLANVKTMAEQALVSGSPGNNPRVPDVDQMIELYKSLW